MIKIKAVTLLQYGNVEQLHYTEVNEPELKSHDLLIEIKGTSVNPFDWKVREGYLANAIPFHSPAIIGWEL